MRDEEAHAKQSNLVHLSLEEVELEKQRILKEREDIRISQVVETLMSLEKCSTLGQQHFKNILKEEAVLTVVSKNILDNYFKADTTTKVTDMKDCLKLVDKKLFLKLISKQLTLDQFKTRVFEVMQGKTEEQDLYWCLDDMRQQLGPEVFDFDVKLMDQYIKMIHGKDTKDLTAAEAT